MRIIVSFFENSTVWGQEIWYRWVDTIWYKVPMVPFWDTFLRYVEIIWFYIMWIARFLCANQGQTVILMKIINGHNLRFSIQGLFTFEIQTYWIISVTIFEQYIFKIHRLCIKLVIPRSQIVSCRILSVFCLCSAISPIPGRN